MSFQSIRTTDLFNVKLQHIHVLFRWARKTLYLILIYIFKFAKRSSRRQLFACSFEWLLSRILFICRRAPHPKIGFESIYDANKGNKCSQVELEGFVLQFLKILEDRIRSFSSSRTTNLVIRPGYRANQVSSTRCSFEPKGTRWLLSWQLLNDKSRCVLPLRSE